MLALSGCVSACASSLAATIYKTKDQASHAYHKHLHCESSNMPTLSHTPERPLCQHNDN